MRLSPTPHVRKFGIIPIDSTMLLREVTEISFNTEIFLDKLNEGPFYASVFYSFIRIQI